MRRRLAQYSLILAAVAVATTANAQRATPARYHAPRAPAMSIDGVISDAEWAKATWTTDFIDIEGVSKPAPAFRTRARLMWDDEYLYIAAELEEPHVWGTLTERDAVIFHDNDFEVFIDPDGDTFNYYELEINALGTVWDLFLTRPYRDHGEAINAWDIHGLKSAVRINGTLNDARDRDVGWTIELALPWMVLKEAAPEHRRPKPGEEWRVNFSRVEWDADIVDNTYVKRNQPEHNWVWSPQGAIALHMPEKWGYVRFVE
ncbi:MAG TPA: carbohydrate-binding family 9-like protein [Longimicrobiales bacterium]